MKKVWLRNVSTPVTIMSKVSEATKDASVCNGKGVILGNPGKKDITYQQRKAMQPEYSDLFRALLRLPDKQVQQRVLDAINGVQISKCTKCDCAYETQTTEATTQTENNLPIINVKSKFGSAFSKQIYAIPLSSGNKAIAKYTPTKVLNRIIRTTDKSIENHNAKDIELNKNSQPFIKPVPIEKLMGTTVLDVKAEEDLTINKLRTRIIKVKKKKPKRKRKDRGPQVIKKSYAHIAQAEAQPKIKRPRLDLIKSEGTDPQYKTEATEENNQGLDQFSLYIESYLKNVEPNLDSSPKSKFDHIMRTLGRDYINMNDSVDGLLPIHAAIIANDELFLKRNIFLWTHIKKYNINELFTDEDENLVQLAIANDSIPAIVEILLAAEVNPNVVDDKRNTIIHLAILNEVHQDTLHILMQHIDLSTISTLNDDGFSVLHLAVRSNQFVKLEIILNMIDKRLLGYVKYKKNNVETDEQIIKYYAHMCDSIDLKYVLDSSKNVLKQSFLNAMEMKTGNTGLFYAIEKKMEKFVYLLLAHLSNPLITNYNGHDAKSYLAENGKILGLSLVIDKRMEKLLNVIQNHTTN